MTISGSFGSERLVRMAESLSNMVSSLANLTYTVLPSQTVLELASIVFKDISFFSVTSFAFEVMEFKASFDLAIISF